MVYQYRMSQSDLSFAYDGAKARMDAHPEKAEEHRKTIESLSHFEKEKDALMAAIQLEKEKYSGCQIWAKIEKVDDIYRIVDYWIVTDDNKAKLAAEYIGMALMYDTTRILNIIDDGVNVDDVVAYW